MTTTPARGVAALSIANAAIAAAPKQAIAFTVGLKGIEAGTFIDRSRPIADLDFGSDLTQTMTQFGALCCLIDPLVEPTLMDIGASARFDATYL